MLNPIVPVAPGASNVWKSTRRQRVDVHTLHSSIFVSESRRRCLGFSHARDGWSRLLRGWQSTSPDTAKERYIQLETSTRLAGERSLGPTPCC